MANLKHNWPILKRLLRYGIYWKKSILLATSILLISSILEIIGPVLISYFINNILTKHNLNKKIIFILFFSFLISQSLSIILNYFQILLFSKIAIKIIKKIRIQVMKSALLQPLPIFHVQPIGKIVSKITNDTETIKELYDTVLTTILRNFLLITIMLITMFILQWKMAIISMILLPVIIIIMIIYQKYSTPILRNIRSYLAQINHKFNETINGMLVIQQFSQEKKFKKSIKNTSELHYQMRMKALKLEGFLLRPLISFFSTLILCGLIALFSFYSIKSCTIGILYAFISYLNRLNEPLIAITTQQSILQQAIISGERIFKLIDTNKQRYGKDLSKLKTGEIKISNLYFSYQKQSPIILHNINLKISSKQFVALVGHTGSGKSTLANLLMGYYPIKMGEILLDQRILNSLSYETLRNGIYMIQQEPVIFTGTVLSNITLGKKIKEEKIWNILKIVQLDKLIQSMPKKLYFILRQNGNNLSIGQKQLLSISRILILNPKILILDEATANIDSETEQIIQKAILSIRKNCTLIIIAHRFSTIIEADKIIVLKKGKIVETGNHNELIIKKGTYYRMYDAQSSY